MFPRSSGARGRRGAGRGPPANPNHGPPANPNPEHSLQRRDGGNSNYPPRPAMLPPYNWNPPLFSPPVPPLRAPAMANGRKRQNEDYGSHVAKRLRVDSSSHPQMSAPPFYGPDQNVAGSSRWSFTGVDVPHPSPQALLHPQAPVIPEDSSNVWTYARDQLSRQMVELSESCQQQHPDLLRKERCRNQLQQDLQKEYPVGRLYLTGSSMNGLGCRSSDADMCLVLRENKRQKPIYVLSVLRKLFRSLSYVERVQLITAKVPILRFREKGSDLEFDLNVNNTVGIRNTFLLRSYADADPRVRPIILTIKKWAKHHQINDASQGTLSSYTLVLLALHYLQTRSEPVLPSLQRDHPDCFSPLLEVDMVPEAARRIPRYLSRNQSSPGELLVGFLKYYATEFRWDKHVICVREARTLPRSSLPEWRNKFICVEEPFERNNVARAVHQQVKFDTIKAQFAQSWQKLQRSRDLRAILPVRAIINKEQSRI